MALTLRWDRVSERFHNLDRHVRLRPTVAAMLRLVATLREDPRLSGVEPSVSLASLNLKLDDCKRYVLVAWSENEPQGFEVSFVDPPLEFTETVKVPEPQVVATIIEYLDRLKKGSEQGVGPR
jgi:hypothetical protein